MTHVVYCITSFFKSEALVEAPGRGITRSMVSEPQLSNVEGMRNQPDRSFSKEKLLDIDKATGCSEQLTVQRQPLLCYCSVGGPYSQLPLMKNNPLQPMWCTLKRQLLCYQYCVGSLNADMATPLLENGPPLFSRSPLCIGVPTTHLSPELLQTFQNLRAGKTKSELGLYTSLEDTVRPLQYSTPYVVFFEIRMSTFGNVKKTGAQDAETIEAAEETLAIQFTSRPGSCKSLCASSRKSSVALKALRIAQLQEYRVKREVELQRALLEAQSKTELAKIELEAKEDSSDEAWEPVASTDRLAQYVKSCQLDERPLTYAGATRQLSLAPKSAVPITPSKWTICLGRVTTVEYCNGRTVSSSDVWKPSSDFVLPARRFWYYASLEDTIRPLHLHCLMKRHSCQVIGNLFRIEEYITFVGARTPTAMFQWQKRTPVNYPIRYSPSDKQRRRYGSMDDMGNKDFVNERCTFSTAVRHACEYYFKKVRQTTGFYETIRPKRRGAVFLNQAQSSCRCNNTGPIHSKQRNIQTPIGAADNNISENHKGSVLIDVLDSDFWKGNGPRMKAKNKFRQMTVDLCNLRLYSFKRSMVETGSALILWLPTTKQLRFIAVDHEQHSGEHIDCDCQLDSWNPVISVR
ncbi:hypothetical protein CLF_101561, partial [Clonorchis sinensis]